MTKFAQLFIILCFIIVILCFNFLLLGYSLDQAHPLNLPWQLGIGIGFVFAFVFDRLFILGIQTLKIRKSSINFLNSSPLKLTSYSYVLYQIIKTAIVIIIALAIFLPLLSESSKLIFGYKTIIYTREFYFLVSGYILYIILRFPLSHFFEKIFNKIQVLPTLTLQKDGISVQLEENSTISFKPSFSIAKETGKFFFVAYSEIEQLEILDYVEADTYYQYQISINPKLMLQSVKDLVQFQRGIIKRPEVYIDQTSTGNKTVVIKGKDFFYFITFAPEDVANLQQAYKAYKLSH